MKNQDIPPEKLAFFIIPGVEWYYVQYFSGGDFI